MVNRFEGFPFCHCGDSYSRPVGFPPVPSWELCYSCRRRERGQAVGIDGRYLLSDFQSLGICGDFATLNFCGGCFTPFSPSGFAPPDVRLAGNRVCIPCEYAMRESRYREPCAVLTVSGKPRKPNCRECDPRKYSVWCYFCGGFRCRYCGRNEGILYYSCWTTPDLWLKRGAICKPCIVRQQFTPWPGQRS